MTREQYIMLRNRGDFNIVYEYYKELFDPKKHKPFFSIEELIQLLPMNFNVNVIMDKCVRHFDQKFEIKVLSDKNGNIVKIL